MAPAGFRLLLFAGLAVLVAGGAMFWHFSHRAETPQSLPTAPPLPPPDGIALAPAPVPTRNPLRPQEMVQYPDGTWMPCLNGVTDPAVLTWPAGVPFSPIIGKRTGAKGLEWYVHADGTYTTTQMMWRSDVGREIPITHVARPTPVAPVDPIATQPAK